MSESKSEDISLEPVSGFHKISKVVSDEAKVQREKERSLFHMSKYVGITNFFSSSLKEQVRVSDHGKIPSIMFLCIEQLKVRGTTEKGIFRVPGTHSKIQETKKLLEAGKKVEFGDIDIMTVASIFKLWLRELPTPLIPYCNYSKLIALGRTLKELKKAEKVTWMNDLRTIIRGIPKPEQDCLRALMEVLYKIGQNSAVNMMHPKNLAIVITPNILYKKPEEDEAQDALLKLSTSEEMAPAIAIVTVLIEQMDFFFFKKDQDMDEKSEMKTEMNLN